MNMEIQARKSYVRLILGIAILASLASLGNYAFAFSSTRAWQLGVMALLNSLVLMGVYLGLWAAVGRPRIQSHRQISRIAWIAIVATEFSFISASFTVSGLEVFYSLMLLFLISVAARPPALTESEYPWAVISALTAAALILLPLTLPLSYRFPLSASTTFVVYLFLGTALFAYLLFGSFFPFGLRVRLALLAVFVSLISVAVIATLADNITTGALRTAGDTALQGAATQLGSQLENYLLNNLEIVRSQAQLPILRNYLLEAERPSDQRRVTFLEVGQALLSFQSRNPSHILSYGLLNAKGIVVADTVNRYMGSDESAEEYFRRAMLGISNVSDLRYRGSPPQWTLAFAAPVRAADGHPIGVLRFWLSPAAIQQIVLANNGLVGEGSFGTVVDENGMILSQGNYVLIGYFTTAPDPATLETLRTARRLLPDAPIQVAPMAGLAEGLRDLQKTPLFDVEVKIPGITPHRERMAARRLSVLPWKVVYSQEETFFTRPLRVQRNRLLFNSVLLTLGMALLGSLAAIGIVRPLRELTEAAQKVQQGELNVTLSIRSRDESGILAQAFQLMIDNTRELLTNLEARVRERTAELAERSSYLQAVAEVGRLIFTLRDPQVLMSRVVEVVRARFGLYYVGLFEVDGSGEWAVLRAGSGEAGKAMLARGHRIRVGSGMIGWSIAHNQPRIAQQAELDAVRLRTPELPETRSEAALPLRTRSGVLGALTIQSDRPNAFNADNLAVFQVLADLIASALENARLYAEMQSTLHSLEHVFGERVRRTLEEYFHVHKSLTYRSDGTQVWEDPLAWYPEMEEAIRLQQPVAGAQIPYGPQQIYPLAIPLILRDQVAGVLRTYKPAEKGPWSEQEIEVLNNIVQQLALTLEAAQLYEQSQQRAGYERVLSEVTSKVWSASGIEAILQTAVRELGRALNASELEIALTEDHHEG
jgi:GAF domain-containing protein/HAMP domain-containing protein